MAGVCCGEVWWWVWGVVVRCVVGVGGCCGVLCCGGGLLWCGGGVVWWWCGCGVVVWGGIMVVWCGGVGWYSGGVVWWSGVGW